MRRFVLIFPLVTLMAAIAYFLIYKQMPQYALQQVEKATHMHDRELFEKYVDVEAMSGSLAEQFVSYKRQSSTAQSNLSPELNTTFKTLLTEYVQTGKYTPASLGSAGQAADSPAALLMQLQDYITTKAQFAGFSTMNIRDGFADVTADFYVPANNKFLRLEMRMADKGKHWQIIGIKNLDSFIKELK